MDTNNKVDKNLAQKQWDALCDTYIEMGCSLTILDPIEGLPDLVFPGDAVFLYDNNVVSSNFFHEERKNEVIPRVNWFREHGFTTYSLPNEIKYEGNADTIKFGELFFGGHGVRSQKEAYPLISAMLDIDIIPLECRPPSFHLDVALAPLSNGLIAYAPDSFTEDSIEKIEQVATKTIKVSIEDASILAVNSILLDDTVLISTKNAPQLENDLKSAGYNVKTFDMSEYYKSGGGIKCLTLEHYQK
jgi:N-dimethylarginine dimethylaminohydrolase